MCGGALDWLQYTLTHTHTQFHTHAYSSFLLMKSTKEFVVWRKWFPSKKKEKSPFSSALVVPVFKKSSSWLSKLEGDKKGESSSSLKGIRVKKGNKTHRQRWKNYLWRMSRFSIIVLSDEIFRKCFQPDKFSVYIFKSKFLARVNWDIKMFPSLRYLSFFCSTSSN